jgi:DNA-binding transcriptional MerR regulator
MHPRPIADTSSPWVPSFRFCILLLWWGSEGSRAIVGLRARSKSKTVGGIVGDLAVIEPKKRAEAELEQELPIAEAVRRSGLGAHTLRYYERAGLLLDVARESSSGHRRYSEGDLEWIDFVTKLRSTGMPIRQIRRYAELVRSGPGNEAGRLEILEAHRAEVLAQIEEHQRNLERIDYKIGLYRSALDGG